MIYISAGHNPQARGACNGDFCEHDETVIWANNIVNLLNDEYSIDAEYVPTGSLKSKVNHINKDPNAKIAVEIHFNSNVNAKGSETLYCPKSSKGKLLATCIQTGFAVHGIFQPNRGAKEGWYRMDRPDIVDYKGDLNGDEVPDYFLKRTRPVAVIVEPQFIYHKEDILENRTEGCDALAHSIATYYKNEIK